MKNKKTITDLKNLTIKTANHYIKSQGITIIPGKAYNLYVCGCIIENEKDPNILFYYPAKRSKQRSCPIHKGSEFISKYKICQCGKEYFSIRVSSSERCAACYHSKGAVRAPKHPSYRNIRLYDPTRYDCEYRPECLTKYDKYQCVPCKNCKKYKQKIFDVAEYLCPAGGMEPSNNFKHTSRELF